MSRETLMFFGINRMCGRGFICFHNKKSQAAHLTLPDNSPVLTSVGGLCPDSLCLRSQDILMMYTLQDVFVTCSKNWGYSY